MPSPAPNFLLLYVADPPASARFYETLLGQPPVEASPTFALLALESGLMLGLWRRDTVQPVCDAAAQAGRHELDITVADEAAVNACHRHWTALGLAILQPPTRMDFGFTFTATDPDGHRLRVFAPQPA